MKLFFICLFTLVSLSYAQTVQIEVDLKDIIKELIRRGLIPLSSQIQRNLQGLNGKLRLNLKKDDILFPKPSPKLSPNQKNRLKPTPKEGILRINKSDCNCRVGSSKKIINGQVVEPNSIPWQVSLANLEGDHFCGGIIINNFYVLTAAHCVKDKSPREIKARFGLHYLDDPNIIKKTRYVSKFYNPEFLEPTLPGDIAILKLSKPIEFVQGKIEPACFNTVAKNYGDNELMISGWGTTVRSKKNLQTGKLITGETSKVLRKAFVNQSDRDCKPHLICIDSDDGESVCQGDSGGPIHNFVNGRASVEGVASYVVGSNGLFGDVTMCTGEGAFSRLSYYKNFFETVVSDNYCTL